jgi:hypothetical protein
MTYSPRVYFRKQCIIAVIAAAVFTLLAALSAEARQDMYGAIAYSQSTGAHGFSNDYSTRSVAQGRALRECNARSNNNDCRVAIWFKNSCGAIAVSKNGAYGSAWNSNLQYAKYNAASSCNKYGGSYCQVTRWACTSR